METSKYFPTFDSKMITNEFAIVTNRKDQSLIKMEIDES